MAFGLIKTLGLAGVALTAWYFLDPKKGADRRESFAKGAKDLYDNAGEEIGRFGKNAGEEMTRLGKDIASGVSETVSRASGLVQELTGKTTGSAETSSARSENHLASATSK